MSLKKSFTRFLLVHLFLPARMWAEITYTKSEIRYRERISTTARNRLRFLRFALIILLITLLIEGISIFAIAFSVIFTITILIYQLRYYNSGLVKCELE